MKVLLILFLISILQETVIGRTVVKRDCNDCCCTSNCNNCCSSSCSNCNNCCQSNSNCCQSNSNCCQSKSNCNNCCNSNCNSCQNCQNNCKENCSSNCGTTEQVPVLVPFPPVQPAPTVNDTTLNIYNFTANITLTNVINTVNNISVPITLNNTNINHITVEEVPNIIKEETHAPIINTERCCTVILPRVCNETGCQVVTRTECSPRCTREVITIPDISYPTYPIYQPVFPRCGYNGIATQCPILQPPPPQPQLQPQQLQCPPLCSPPCPQSSGCIQPYVQPYIPPQPPVQTCQYPYYPYSYCGTELNCLGCYFCNGRFNPQECASSRQCPLPCLAGTGRL